MTTFEMPEPTLHESGPTDYFGRLLCYTEEDMKNALRDVLEQAERELLKTAAHLGIVNHFATKQFAEAIRTLKEQIK